MNRTLKSKNREQLEAALALRVGEGAVRTSAIRKSIFGHWEVDIEVPEGPLEQVQNP